jgi:murein L,D-transpeptidase YafK
LSRPVVRALLASAAITAAIALAGCNADDIAPNGRAAAPLSPKTVSLISEKNMEKESPILLRIFKEESELEVWKQTRGGQYALLKTYPICKWSGDLGPKKREGDRQAPEGFYTITPGLMNPNSNYYLAFNTGFPNAYDRSHGYTGSELMVHGDCSSRGCYAMTDEQIQEIYALARESFFGGQSAFQFEAFPFRMTALNMAKHRNNPNFAFWKMLKEGYDNFEATRQEPKVAVCEKRYVFDGTSEDGKAIRSNPSGACPAYRLDPAIASTVLDYRHQEQTKMASYISQRVATVAPHSGDGGTNPVFMAELANSNVDNSGRYTAASLVAAPEGGSRAPGALPHVPNPPGTTIPKVGKPVQPAVARPAPAAEPEPQPVQVASVRLPTPAPQAKLGEAPPEEKPVTVASFFDNIFNGGSQPQQSAPTQVAPTQVAAAPSRAEPAQQASLRGTNTEMAAKPKHSRVAAAAPVSLQAKPQKVAAQQQQDPIWDQPKPKSVWDQPKPQQAKAEPPKAEPAKPAVVAKAEPAAKPEPAAKQRVKVAAAGPAKEMPAREPEVRTASATTTGSGLLTGAQPVVPAGSFSSFR